VTRRIFYGDEWCDIYHVVWPCGLWFHGPAGKGHLGSSPPVIYRRLVSPSPVSRGSHACPHANEQQQEKQSHTHCTLSLSCGLFIWDHNTFCPLGSVASREGRELGIQSRDSGWRAAGIVHNPAQFFFGLIEAHHSEVRLICRHWHVFYSCRPPPSRRTFPRVRLPRTISVFSFQQQQQYRFKHSRWSLLVKL
jgi:hypothetical protein